MDTYLQTSAQCEICLKGAFLLTNLYKHMRHAQKYEEEQVRQMKEDIRIKKFEGRKKNPCVNAAKCNSLIMADNII